MEIFHIAFTLILPPCNPVLKCKKKERKPYTALINFWRMGTEIDRNYHWNHLYNGVLKRIVATEKRLRVHFEQLWLNRSNPPVLTTQKKENYFLISKFKIADKFSLNVLSFYFFQKNCLSWWRMVFPPCKETQNTNIEATMSRNKKCKKRNTSIMSVKDILHYVMSVACLVS